MNNCYNYNSLRFCIDNDKINIYPCCFLEQKTDFLPLFSFNIDEILNIPESIFIQKILEIYNKKIIIQMPKICKTRLMFPVDDNICHWNDNQLSEILVSCTQTCNLNCIMCRDNIIVNKKTDEVYYYILNAIKNLKLKSIHLTEAGEPFYHKDKALSYIESISPNNCNEIFIVSNLTMLNENDINRLSEINKKININLAASIDGITEKTYKKIRRNNFFNKVMTNSDLLIKHNILKQINFVVQDSNLNELIDAYYFWKDKKLLFVPIIINDWKDQSHHYRILNSDIYKQFLSLFKK